MTDPKTPAGGHADDAVSRPASEREAATVPPAGRCPIHTGARVVYTDPTGGDSFMGGPVLIPVCSACGREAVEADEFGTLVRRGDDGKVVRTSHVHPGDVVIPPGVSTSGADQ